MKRSASLVSLAAVVACGGVSACAPKARIEVPAAVLSDKWSVAQSSDIVGDVEPAAFALGSPQLRALIDRAMATSPNLLGATARVEQAEALLKTARGAALPLVSASGEAVLGQSRAGGPFDFANSFASLDASLTIDLGGGMRAGRRAAGARLSAARFDRDALALSIGSEIARVFVLRATLDRRVTLVSKSIDQATELDRIVRIRQHEGVATRVDVGLQAIRLKELLTQRERLLQAFDQTRTALALLVGEEAPRFDSAPASLESLVTGAPPVPDPSELVTIRPDVLAAEARLVAAGGDVQQARAAFFPKVNLSLGRAAQAPLGAPFLSSVVLGADLLAPIFDRHRLRSNLELVSAQQREAAQVYRQAVLTAFTEVEDALSMLRHASERAVLLADVERDASVTSDLARRQYLEGDADLRQLLDAQDLLIAAQDARAVGAQERLEADIALFKATRRLP